MKELVTYTSEQYVVSWRGHTFGPIHVMAGDSIEFDLPDEPPVDLRELLYPADEPQGINVVPIRAR